MKLCKPFSYYSDKKQRKYFIWRPRWINGQLLWLTFVTAHGRYELHGHKRVFIIETIEI